MPLTDRDYYTFSEAVERVRQRLPDEDPVENLVWALRSLAIPRDFADEPALVSWVHDERDNEDIAMPYYFWGIAEEHDSTKNTDGLTFRPAWYDTKAGVAEFMRDDKPRYARGPIRIGCSSLDEFLKHHTISVVKGSADTGAYAQRKGRRPAYDWEAMWRQTVLIANTPDGLPDSPADLERMLLEWFEVTQGKAPASSTLREKISVLYRQLREA
jgi:hypothetical protein